MLGELLVGVPVELPEEVLVEVLVAAALPCEAASVVVHICEVLPDELVPELDEVVVPLLVLAAAPAAGLGESPPPPPPQPAITDAISVIDTTEARVRIWPGRSWAGWKRSIFMESLVLLSRNRNPAVRAAGFRRDGTTPRSRLPPSP
ncbi:hypothetical protein ACNSZH_10885 [Burkholderia gladioli]|uniref:hypothetical protein n=1 Tax=Burkholderia gladioli TaxID=28095 RepID=UPI003B984161